MAIVPSDQRGSMSPIKRDFSEMEGTKNEFQDGTCLAGTPKVTPASPYAGPFRGNMLPAEKFQVKSKGPVPWSWTLPSYLDSPDRASLPHQRSTAPAASTSPRRVADTLTSPVSSGLLSSAHGRKTVGEMHHPPTGMAETLDSGLVDMALPERFLLDSKSPVPWSWRMPLRVDSPFICASNFQASHSPGPSALRGEHDANIVMQLQQLGSAGDSTRQIMEFLRTSEEQFKDDKHMLAQVYRAAVDVYCVPRPGVPVHEFCDLSVKCIRVLCRVDPDGARKFHSQLLACSLRRSDARVYVASASMEQHLGSFPRAIEILQQGLELDAQPSDMLHRMLQQMLADAPLQTSQQTMNPMQEARCKALSPGGVKTPRGEFRHDATSVGTAREDINTNSVGLWEEVSVMRDLMERMQRDLQDFRAQFRGTTDTACCQGHCCQGHGCHGHPCLRCCREAVEGAVETLMTSMVGVRDNLQGEGTLQPRHDWQSLADEVWDIMTRVGPQRRRCEAQGLRCDVNKHRVQQQLAASFAEIPELRNIIDQHLSKAARQSEMLKGEPEQRRLHAPLQRQRAVPMLAVLEEHLGWDAYKENICPKSSEHGRGEFRLKPMQQFNTLPVSHSVRCLR